MITDVGSTVVSGSLPVALALALLAGVVSFASPCVLPLVPGFLAYVTGLTDEQRRTRLVAGALLFVLGFGAVLVSVAVALGVALEATQQYRATINRVAGVIVIALALVYLGFIGQRGLPVRWRPAAGLAAVGAPFFLKHRTFPGRPSGRSGIQWTPVFVIPAEAGTPKPGDVLIVEPPFETAASRPPQDRLELNDLS